MIGILIYKNTRIAIEAQHARRAVYLSMSLVVLNLIVGRQGQFVAVFDVVVREMHLQSNVIWGWRILKKQQRRVGVYWRANNRGTDKEG